MANRTNGDSMERHRTTSGTAHSRTVRTTFVRAAFVRAAYFGTAVAAVAASCGSAAAATADIPPDSQLITLDVPMSCTLPILSGIIGKQTVHLHMTGIAPLQLRPVQPFYLGDVSAQLDFPATLIDVPMGLFGSRSAGGTVTHLNFSATGLTPAAYDAAQPHIAVDTVPLVYGQAATVRFPADDFLQIGPFTPADSGAVSLGFTGANGVIQLYGAGGNKDFFPLPFNCSAGGGAVDVADIAVNGDASEDPVALHSGIRTEDIPAPPSGKSVLAHLPLRCDVGSLGTRDLDLDLQSGAPLSVTPRQSFALDATRGRLTIPMALATALVAGYPGAAFVDGALDRLDIASDDTNPSSLNAALTPLLLPATPLSAGAAAVLDFPVDGSIGVGDFVSRPLRRSDRFSLGALGGSLAVHDAAGHMIGQPLSLNCAAPNPPVYINGVTLLRRSAQ
jgi:hypothetical protein